MFISSNLKHLRTKFLFTQAQMADEIGVSRVTYNNYESGRLEVNIPTLIKLSRKYGISLDEMVNSDLSSEKIDYSIVGGNIIVGESNHGTINNNRHITQLPPQERITSIEQRIDIIEKQVSDIIHLLQKESIK